MGPCIATADLVAPARARQQPAEAAALAPGLRGIAARTSRGPCGHLRWSRGLRAGRPGRLGPSRGPRGCWRQKRLPPRRRRRRRVRRPRPGVSAAEWPRGARSWRLLEAAADPQPLAAARTASNAYALRQRRLWECHCMLGPCALLSRTGCTQSTALSVRRTSVVTVRISTWPGVAKAMQFTLVASPNRPLCRHSTLTGSLNAVLSARLAVCTPSGKHVWSSCVLCTMGSPPPGPLSAMKLMVQSCVIVTSRLPLSSARQSAATWRARDGVCGLGEHKRQVMKAWVLRGRARSGMANVLRRESKAWSSRTGRSPEAGHGSMRVTAPGWQMASCGAAPAADGHTLMSDTQLGCSHAWKSMSDAMAVRC